MSCPPPFSHRCFQNSPGISCPCCNNSKVHLCIRQPDIRLTSTDCSFPSMQQGVIWEVINSDCMGSCCSQGRTHVTSPGMSASCSSDLKPESPCPGGVLLLDEYSCKDKRNRCFPKLYAWILVHLDEALEENKIQILVACCEVSRMPWNLLHWSLFRCGSVWCCCFDVTQGCIRWPKNPALVSLVLKKGVFCC